MRRIQLSFAVIGMVRKDRCGTEQLFGEHRPDEQVRPGRRPERKQQVGAAPVGLIVAAVRPMRKRASRLPSSRHRSSLLASCTDDSASPRSSRTIATLFDGSAGTLPPASGSFRDLGRPGDPLADSARRARPPESGRSSRVRRCAAAPASARKPASRTARSPSP